MSGYRYSDIGSDSYVLMLQSTGGIFFIYDNAADELLVIDYSDDSKTNIHNLFRDMEVSGYADSESKNKLLAIRSGRSEVNVSDEILIRAEADAQLRWYRVTVRYVPDKDIFIGNFHDIDDTKREVEQLRKKALIDPLSKVYNRAAAIEKIKELLSRRPPEKLCALIVLDIDNFKRINDTFGHLYGDAVIAMAAGSIKNVLDADDIMGRFGGDEFFAFIGNAERSDLEKKLENINAAVVNMRIDKNNENDISCSIGVAPGNGGSTYEEMFRRADSALYLAKKNGKNRYEYFDGNYHDGTISYAGNVKDADESNTEHSITEIALEIASKSKNAESAIFNIMRHAAMLMGLDCIEVMYYDVMDGRVDILFQYHRILNGQYNVVISDKKKGYYSHEDMVLFRERLSEAQTLIYRPCVKEGFSRKFSDVLAYSDNISMLYASNVTQSDSTYCVMTFKDYSNDRVWSEKELHDALEVEKIISMYLNSAYVTTDREKTMEKKLAYMPSGAYRVAHFFEETGKLTFRARSKGQHLAMVHYHIQGVFDYMKTYGQKRGMTFIDGFVRKLLSKDRETHIVTQFDAYMNIAMLMSCDDIEKTKAEVLKDMNDYSAGADLPYENALIIRAAVCPFEPGMIVGDALDSARYVSLHSNSDKNALFDAEFVPMKK